MLKKILAIAIVATLFACSSSDDDNDKKPSSSGGVPSGGDGSSSSVASGEPVFNVIYDFEEDSDNTIGYTFGGKVTLENDCAIDDKTGGCAIDESNGEEYKNWIPNGVLTLKNFSFNGETDLSNNGGGLIVRGLEIKKYAAIRFEARSTAEGPHSFRIKVGQDEKSAAIRKFFTPSTTEFETIEIEITKENFSVEYNNTEVPRAELIDYALENSTEVEFLIPLNLFVPNTSETKHTLEIDNFAVANK